MMSIGAVIGTYVYWSIDWPEYQGTMEHTHAQIAASISIDGGHADDKHVSYSSSSYTSPDVSLSSHMYLSLLEYASA